VHVSDELLLLAFRSATGRCSLVSDAISAAGLGDGDFRLGDVEIEVREGVSRRLDGTLAGSAGRLCDGLARLGRIGIDPGTAIAAVSSRPARLTGAPGLGRLERGGPANLLVVDDQLVLQRVFASGSVV
jgi:N-acetylglucosamine-6-phosphate deacetylase